MYVAMGSASLARSKSGAAIVAPDKLEFLSDVYRRDPSDTDLTLGDHGPQVVQVTNPNDGRVLNPSQLDYLVPLAVDMPKINNIIVETIDPNGPYGAKEAGMSVAMSAAQAYCGAVCNAIGVDIHEFPLTPDRILKAIEEKGK
jgi:hypothetical protein